MWYWPLSLEHQGLANKKRNKCVMLTLGIRVKLFELQFLILNSPPSRGCEETKPIVRNQTIQNLNAAEKVQWKSQGVPVRCLSLYACVCSPSANKTRTEEGEEGGFCRLQSMVPGAPTIVNKKEESKNLFYYTVLYIDESRGRGKPDLFQNCRHLISPGVHDAIFHTLMEKRESLFHFISSLNKNRRKLLTSGFAVLSLYFLANQSRKRGRNLDLMTAHYGHLEGKKLGALHRSLGKRRERSLSSSLWFPGGSGWLKCEGVTAKCTFTAHAWHFYHLVIKTNTCIVQYAKTVLCIVLLLVKSDIFYGLKGLVCCCNILST